MIEAVKRFVTRVLLLHLLLLIVVVVGVIYGSRSVYLSARSEAINESGERLEILAQQTGRGIENYYLSVMSDLDAILRDESAGTADAAAATQRANTAQPGFPRGLRRRPMGEGRPVAVTQGLTGIMWRQLRGRISNLFLIDNETGRVLAAYPAGSEPFAEEIAREHGEWFKSLKTPSMSRMQAASEKGKVGEYHVIAIPGFENPPRGPGGGGPGEPPDANGPPPQRGVTVAAIVPVKIVKEEFFDPLNAQHVVNAALLDESGNALISIDEQLNGTNIIEGMDPAVRDRVKKFVTGRKDGVLVMDDSYRVGGQEFSPRIIAFEKIEGLPGREWTMLASSPLSDVEGLVDGVFKDAVFWALLVTLSVTAILVSTSVTMIRSRVKLERQRHDLLTRELDQARQIQMAWLPDAATAPPGLEVCAANLPASHISGDFYNWFVLPNGSAGRQATSVDLRDHEEAGGKIALVIGDVTGHGMAAAFLMATTQLLVRMTLLRYQDPGRALAEVNRQLCTQGFRGQFVTMLVIVLDPASGTMEIATAGHPGPLVERGGKLVPLEIEPQLVLGVDPTETYKTQGFVLEAGSCILLYTDGVIEAEAASGEQYGLGRLEKVAAAGPQGCVDGVLADVKAFCGERELHDDVTLVAARVAGESIR